MQVVRVLNGGTPEGADWHRRLLDRLTLATEYRPALLSSDTARALGLLLGFRDGVRHLQAFDHWLQELIALAESDHPSPGSTPLRCCLWSRRCGLPWDW